MTYEQAKRTLRRSGETMSDDEGIFQRTTRLRIVRDREWISDDRSRIVDTLQQLWTCSDGDGGLVEDWRDVEVVEP